MSDANRRPEPMPGLSDETRLEIEKATRKLVGECLRFYRDDQAIFDQLNAGGIELAIRDYLSKRVLRPAKRKPVGGQDTKPVRCRDCRYWRANPTNPRSGIGSCAIQAPASKRPGALWPRGDILCADWRKAKTSTATEEITE